MAPELNVLTYSLEEQEIFQFRSTQDPVHEYVNRMNALSLIMFCVAILKANFANYER